MGWASHRIEEYRHGSSATWLECRMLEHANPVHFVLALLAAVGFVYGLWMHDWMWIGGAVVLSILGHAYSWLWRPRQTRPEQLTASGGGGGRPG